MRFYNLNTRPETNQVETICTFKYHRHRVQLSLCTSGVSIKAILSSHLINIHSHPLESLLSCKISFMSRHPHCNLSSPVQSTISELGQQPWDDSVSVWVSTAQLSLGVSGVRTDGRKCCLRENTLLLWQGVGQ